MTGRTGRRPGNSGTREAILEAARARFAADGYDRATIRAVASDAGVDPALVHRFYGTKAQLFAAAMRLSLDPEILVPALVAGGPEGIGERLVRLFLGVWEDPGHREALRALLRSAVVYEQAAAMVREFLSHEVLGPIAAALGSSDAALRAGLAASQLLGLEFARYILRLEPLATAAPDTLVTAVAPTVQRYLTGDLGAS